MKTFKDLLSDIAEKESDAEYDKRMRKTAKTLKRSAKKGKRKKKINVLKRRSDDKLEVIKNRIEKFIEETQPVSSDFSKKPPTFSASALASGGAPASSGKPPRPKAT